MSQDSLGQDLPEGWVEVSFDLLFDNVTSSSLKLPASEYRPAAKHPVIDQGERAVGGFTDDERLLHPGPVPAIVFGDHTRCVKFVSRPFVQGADGVKVLAPSTQVDPKYSYWALKSSTVPSKGYARHFALLRKLRLPLPPLREQHRIVEAIESYFTRLDDVVATLERVQHNLRRYRASVLNGAVEGRLVPTDAELACAEGRNYEPASVLLERILRERRHRWEENELAKMKANGKTPENDKWKAKYDEPTAADTRELPELPAGWCWATIGQLHVSLDQGWSPRCLPRPVTSSDEWGVIKTSAVQHMAYDEDGNKALPSNLQPRPSLEVRPGDILITRAGPRVRVGVCCLVRQARKRLMLCDKVYRLRVDAGRVYPGYLELILNSPRILDDIERIKSGISDSGLNLTQSKFSALAVPLPPHAEQERIASTVIESFAISKVLEQDCLRSQVRFGRLRQSILKCAFEGRLVDHDPTDEPASALLERIKAERSAAVKTKRTENARRSKNA